MKKVIQWGLFLFLSGIIAPVFTSKAVYPQNFWKARLFLFIKKLQMKLLKVFHLPINEIKVNPIVYQDNSLGNIEHILFFNNSYFLQ